MLTQFISLQATDLEIDQIDNAILAEQNGLNERITAMAAREEKITELQDKIVTQRKEARALEAEIADKMGHVRERQSKMMQVQTGREQTALLKEIEDAKKGAKENEEKVLGLMESIEKLTSQIEEEKNLLKGEKEIVSEETEKVKGNIETITKDKKSKEIVRAEQASQIKGSVLKKYDTLRSRRNGLAVVKVVDGVCQGCYMALPPQKFNMLLKGDLMLDCPSCQRMIYYQPQVEEAN
jgi:predicted  nucleic acid-binding Zn-ribbon protein